MILFVILSDISQQEKNGEIKASLKLKIGYVFKKLIKTAKGHYIQANEMEKSVEVDRYSAVLDLNGDYIFYTHKTCVSKDEIHSGNPRQCQLRKMFLS